MGEKVHFDRGHCTMNIFGSIIKYRKNCGGNEENLAFFTVILMMAFRTKNVHCPAKMGFFPAS